MPIPREYATSNPQVRDALALQPPDRGSRIGDFVFPEFRIEAEIVDTVTVAEHNLDTDDMRAPDAEAKQVRFETGETGSVSIVERAFKTTMDSRKIEEAGDRGVDLVAQRLNYLVTDIIDLQEYRIATAAMSGATYDADHETAGANFRTLDLFVTIEAAQDKLVADGNAEGRYMVLGRAAWRAIRQNVEFGKFVAGPTIKAGARDLTLARLAEYLGIEEVRIGDFRRKINGVVTQFWPTDAALLFARQNTLSDRTLGQVAVCPYGQYQNVAEGTLVDARTAKLSGTEELTEVGAYKRYRTLIRNKELGFLWSGVVAT